MARPAANVGNISGKAHIIAEGTNGAIDQDAEDVITERGLA
jgi:glutamate dehydrogenase/leucine dehydrogenase